MQTKSTIGSDFLSKEITVLDKPITLQIWDTAGQERFQSLGTSFFRGYAVCPNTCRSDAVIFVYDVARPETFQALGQWKDSFLIQAGAEGRKDFPMLIVGNKVDSPDRKVTKEQAEAWCRGQGLEHLETSAKDALNVERAFETVAKLVVQNLKEEDIQYDGVDLGESNKKQGGCC